MANLFNGILFDLRKGVNTKEDFENEDPDKVIDIIEKSLILFKKE